MRFKNLIITAFSLFMPFAFVPHRAVDASQWLTLVILILVAMLTAWAGYVINDYYDWDIDRINNPERHEGIASKNILLRRYWQLLILVSILTVVLYIPLQQRYLHWVLWYIPFTNILLYCYAFRLKCTPLVGNVLVALLCSAVPFMLYLADLRLLRSSPGKGTWLLAQYIAFAFMSTLYRELVKDMEDIAGDAACNCRTLPVSQGIAYTKAITFIPAILLFLGSIALTFFRKPCYNQCIIFLGLVVPFALSLWQLSSAVEKQDFTYLSKFIKGIMAAGLVILMLMQ